MIAVDENASLATADVQRRFDQAAPHFDDADFVHAVTRDGLLHRLQPMLVEPGTVVDLGAATGSACQYLSRRFGRSRVMAIDLSLDMLRQLRHKQARFSKTAAVQANATALPLGDQSVAVIFANLLLPWIDDPAAFFREVARVLKKGGLLLFSTLGPDSLLELRKAWASVDTAAHVNRFPDMHDIGDAAVRAGLRDPVLDVDRLTVTYENPAAVFRDLTAAGARNCLRQRPRSLVGKGRFASMSQALADAGNDTVIRLDLELVYGHCWGSGPLATPTEYRVDAGQIGRRR
ncbi:MAG: methyltransferase domain-containing protein [Gammaproteobacteria bacterium]|nr:methyltransferase domain-containing protein [Gammaproteobacteria bacterium]